MKEKIINTATEKFLNLGFKSVTMDDIGNEMGISKKTIYEHFQTKSKLIEACVSTLFAFIYDGICEIRAKKQNPIEELFEIKKFTSIHLKEEKSSPQYQLQKYYPKIYENIKIQQFELIDCCVSENLERGIATGHYRDDLPVPFISRIHFIGILGTKDQRFFPPDLYSNQQIMQYFLEYHLRAICTPKGLQTLQDFIKTNEANTEA
ncbi:MAG TPA: TetR/AcrR family transcriptional regulator [Salinimicrobium sp.]|nr:TetR/AcrR family transcriptional regulator [Salinimicrobium sp.]